MAGFDLGFRVDVKRLFFDRAEVEAAVSRAEKSQLSKAGAFVRRTAKTSIKSAGKKGKVSRPGEPPRSHVGLLKEGIFFAFEPSERTVVIGPVLINRPTGAPETLEFGGDVIVRSRRTGKKTAAHVAARPFMGPALEVNAPKFPSLFTNSVHR